MMCPCCNQPINADRAPMESLREVGLSGTQRRILTILVDANGRYVDKGFMIDTIWGRAAHGGSSDPDSILGTLYARIRKSIEPYGWTISRDIRGRGAEGRHRIERFP